MDREMGDGRKLLQVGATHHGVNPDGQSRISAATNPGDRVPEGTRCPHQVFVDRGGGSVQCHRHIGQSLCLERHGRTGSGEDPPVGLDSDPARTSVTYASKQRREVRPKRYFSSREPDGVPGVHVVEDDFGGDLAKSVAAIALIAEPAPVVAGVPGAEVERRHMVS